MKKSWKNLLIVLASGVVLVGLLAGNSDESSRFTAPPLRCQNAEARWETLDNLRSAWSERPTEISTANDKAERRFLNRVIQFVQNSKDREVYPAACRFWNECYRDHTSRYDHFVDEKP